MYTVQQLIDKYKEELNQSVDVGMWKPSFFQRQIEDAIIYVCRETNGFKVIYTTNIVANTGDYTLPVLASGVSAIITVDRVEILGKQGFLLSWNEYETDKDSTIDENYYTSESPQGYILFEDMKTIRIWKTPSVALTNGLVIAYTGYPTLPKTDGLVQTGYQITLEPALMSLVDNYVMEKAYLKDKERDLAVYQRNLLELGCKKVKTKMLNKSTDRKSLPLQGGMHIRRSRRW